MAIFRLETSLKYKSPKMEVCYHCFTFKSHPLSPIKIEKKEMAYIQGV